jgi:hypothetical protein
MAKTAQRISTKVVRKRYSLECDPPKPVGQQTQLARADFWRPEEDAYVREWHGRVPEAEIALRLGRTLTAVNRRRREMKLRPAYEVVEAEYWTTTTLSQVIGVPYATIGGWMTTAVQGFERSEAGEWQLVPLPERAFPLVLHWMGQRPLRTIKKTAFRQWVANPLNHWLLRHRQLNISDPKLARTVRHAAEQWGDSWLAIEEVAVRYHVCLETVRLWARRGMLPQSIKFGNYCWYVRESEVKALTERLYG